ncbi:lipopolysaccharide-induced tumor necrosis factor-alpha factor-like isoform X1 [Drosophila suzukii]|uniref:Lipopolysaccharide-induced tumor necrosis factor-alpha factor-like isoform X1 n=1 Tax=Drosophila suzukii TaxID=28584 RepID=A0ABM4TMY4_DROSZ
MESHKPFSYNPQEVPPILNQPQSTQPLIILAPLNVLGKSSSMATCPSCGVRGKTKVEYEASNKTHLLALLICLVGGVCCVCCPYCNDSCQSANHTCSSCGAYVGTFKN